jgi:hypothetical protein
MRSHAFGVTTLLTSLNFLQSLFLSNQLGRNYHAKSLVAKVLCCFKDMDVSPFALHAANQLLMRLKYLVFDDASSIRNHTDYALDVRFIQTCRNIHTGKIQSGAKPRADILERRVRCGNIDIYASVLHAVVQNFSFESKQMSIAGMDTKDDVVLANNIAACADGNARDSNGLAWTWVDLPTTSRPFNSLPETITQSNMNRSWSLAGFADALNMTRVCGTDTTASI